MLRHRGYKSYHGPKKPNYFGDIFSFLKIGNKSKRVLPRDIHIKAYRNPYLSKKHLPTRTKALKTKLTIGLLSIIGILGVILFHPYFNIKQISIVGLEKISRNDLDQIINQILDKKRLWLFNGRNYFLVNADKIEKEIKKNYALNDLKIKFRLPNNLKIVIQEKQAKLLAQDSLPQLNGEPINHYYLVDEEGKIIQEVYPNKINDPSYLALLMLKLQETDKLPINEAVVAPATVQFLLFLQEKIPEKTKINVSFAELADEEGRVINLTTIEGWRIIMDRQNDWEKQMQVLTIFLRDKIKDNRKNLRYIDVRYENRSYYQ